MNPLNTLGILILFTIISAGVFLYIKLIIGIKTDNHKHFVKRPFLMTIAERKFYDILISVVDEKYHVIPQVALSNIVSVNKYEKHKFTYRNRINRYVVDFVLFEKPYFTPHTVIELDDSSHSLPKRESRDRKVDAILEGAGVKIVHIKVAHEYDIEAIKGLLE